MKINEIEELLERYFEGETSIAEEQALRTFFREHEVPDHLVKYQPLFRFIESEKNIQAPERVFQGQIREISVAGTTPAGRSRTAQPGRFYILSGIAASLILLIAMVFLFREDIFNKVKQPTLSPDQELAYTETRQTLLFISGSLNTGLKQIENLQKIDQALTKVQMLNKFFQYQPVNMNINPDEINDQSIKSQ